MASFSNGHTSNASDDDDDDESLIGHGTSVTSSHAKVSSSIFTNMSNTTTNTTTQKSSSSSSLFSRKFLSKRASELLSQNNQTISDILDNVEVAASLRNHDSEDMITPYENSTYSDGNPDIQMDLNDDTTIEQENTTSHKMQTSEKENYIQQIQELKAQLLAKEKELQDMNQEWEIKFMNLHETYRLKSQSNQIDNNAQMNPNHVDHTVIQSQSIIEKKTIPEYNTLFQPLKEYPHKTLQADDIARYSRQLLLSDGFGVEGQKKLLSSSVLVVGAGGIGSTLILYLAASGVKRITIIDFDAVDMSNLHRQVIHKDKDVGLNKAHSAFLAVKDLNPTCECIPFPFELTFENALELVSKHDCVVDACDNPRTRYLINDACILAGKPLVSGSAMGMEGQITVYGYKNCACYRCLYPKPNPSEGCKTCSDNGVLGTVPGVIGILSATEALKILTEKGEVMSNHLLMYDASRCSFMRIKKPPKKTNCAVCSDEPIITNMEQSKLLSTSSRGVQQTNHFSDKEAQLRVESQLPFEAHISCEEYKKIRGNNTPHTLLDVRVRRQYELCSLPGAVNIPLSDIEENIEFISNLSEDGKPIFVICRRGIASIEATRILMTKLKLDESEERRQKITIHNITGGYNAWVNVDPSFPKY